MPSRRYGFWVPTFSKIVAATDFSEDSNLALGYAQELALKFSGDIVLLHVDQPLAPVMMTPELGPSMDVGAMGRIAEEQRMLAQKELDKIAGNTAQSENADLIVLGTHGRTGLAHVLMGSVAERVVQKAPCPVLTIRHPDRKFKHPLDK